MPRGSKSVKESVERVKELQDRIKRVKEDLAVIKEKGSEQQKGSEG